MTAKTIIITVASDGIAAAAARQLAADGHIVVVAGRSEQKTAAVADELDASNFASDTTSLMRFVYQSPLKRLMGLISPEKGAEGLVALAEGAPGTDWVSGAYYEKQKIAKTSEQAYDDRLAERFWELSAEMVGLASLTSN